MSNLKLIFLSFLCLIITASLYAAQPILQVLAVDFHADLSQMGIFMTFTFLGNGIAQAAVVPLTDKYERRSLTQLFLLAGVLANLMMAFSPTLHTALLAGLLIGFSSCSNMLILSFASSITEGSRKGKVTASIMGGVLSGILLSRSFSGIMTELLSWRAVYLMISLSLLAGFAGLLLYPKSRNAGGKHVRYCRLLLSIFALIRRDGDLKRRMISGMSGFFVFNLLWTGLTFLLTGKPFYFNSFTIGLFGLVGISGILASKKIGYLLDRGAGEKIALYAWIILGISWIFLMSASIFSSLSIIGSVVLLIIGITLLDGAMQSQHIANQTLILSSHDEEAGRALTAYMTCNLLIGSVSNLFISLFYSSLQWLGVSLLCIVVCIVNSLIICFNTSFRMESIDRSKKLE